jgi:hypothetical protein
MIFKSFETTDLVAGRTQPVSTGIWSDGTTSWGSGTTRFYTSSLQSTLSASAYEPLNGLYYLNVYDAPSTQSDADIYYSITYGHYAGSGSSTFDTNTSQGSLLYPTKAIYNQYRNLLLSPGDVKFSFATSSIAGNQTSQDSDDIYVLNFRSTKFKDRLDPGQFEVTVSGSNGKITLIDDSRDNPNTAVETGGKRYNLIQGTIESGSLATRYYQAIGSMYPDLGIVVLNPRSLQQLIGSVGWNGVDYRVGPTGSASDNPPDTSYLTGQWSGKFAQMSGLMVTSIQSGSLLSSMKARVTEYVPARHYFVRVKNQEFNYSNNPTFVINDTDNPASSQDIGKLRFADFSSNPKVYITTVGLYNESNDLVAVAKLSQPVLKDFANECLIRIRLDF